MLGVQAVCLPSQGIPVILERAEGMTVMPASEVW